MLINLLLKVLIMDIEFGDSLPSFIWIKDLLFIVSTYLIETWN